MLSAAERVDGYVAMSHRVVSGTSVPTSDNTTINKHHQHARIVDRILNTSTFYATSTAAGVGAPVASAAAFSAATFARRSSS